jgi:hypothetical protein
MAPISNRIGFGLMTNHQPAKRCAFMAVLIMLSPLMVAIIRFMLLLALILKVACI